MGKLASTLMLAVMMMSSYGRNILSGEKFSGWSLRKDQFGRGKRKTGHSEGIAAGASYNKTITRLIARSKKPGWAKGGL